MLSRGWWASTREHAGGTCLRTDSAGGGAFERAFFAAHLEPISTVHRLDVEDLASRDTEHPLHRRGDVLVHAVRKLDHDHRTLAGSANQSARHSARPSAELTENDLHNSMLAPRLLTSSVAI